MRDLGFLDRYRHPHPLSRDRGDAHNGLFMIPNPIDLETYLVVQASNGEDWDHVSVSVRDRESGESKRCPTWSEMCFVHQMFFEDDETAMQLHVSESDNVNFHHYCLHLWRPRRGQKIPRPPAYMVGPVTKP